MTTAAHKGHKYTKTKVKLQKAPKVTLKFRNCACILLMSCVHLKHTPQHASSYFIQQNLAAVFSCCCGHSSDEYPECIMGGKHICVCLSVCVLVRGSCFLFVVCVTGSRAA